MRPPSFGTAALLGGVGAVAVASLAWSVLVGSSFRAVVPDRVFRSGQLGPEELEERIRRHGIRSIVNLRGKKDGREWYRAESEVARRYGVVLYDIDLVPERLPPRPAVEALLDALEGLPKPLLLHCAAGADRTGFASVVAKMALGGARFEEARRELSLRYGHVPFGPATEIGRIFDMYGAYLERTRREGDVVTFARWVREEYVPYGYRARIEAGPLPAVAAPGEGLPLAVRITNTSPEPWTLSRDPSRGIKLGVRLRERGGESWLDYDRHGQRDGVVPPGESLELAVVVHAPKRPGAYELELDLVDEHVTWFEDQGSTPLVWRLVVTPPPARAEAEARP